MKKTFRRAVVLGLLALAAPFAALPLAKPAAPPIESPDAVTEPAATAPPIFTPTPTQRSFDADAEILIKDDGATRTVTVQEFLIGTAACELPPYWPDDAILAQMVAAHSYALSLGGAAFACNSSQCAGWTSAKVLQARWGDDFSRYYARLSALAEEAAGAVLCFEGAPAAACYHSISAGRTEASQKCLADRCAVLTGRGLPLGRRRTGV